MIPSLGDSAAAEAVGALACLAGVASGARHLRARPDLVRELRKPAPEG